jgi:hypothetical protein
MDGMLLHPRRTDRTISFGRTTDNSADAEPTGIAYESSTCYHGGKTAQAPLMAPNSISHEGRRVTRLGRSGWSHHVRGARRGKQAKDISCAATSKPHTMTATPSRDNPALRGAVRVDYKMIEHQPQPHEPAVRGKIKHSMTPKM